MKLAVICAVYNEEVLLPQFLDYYAPQVDAIFLLDNESTDRTPLIARCCPNVIVSRYTSEGQFSDLALSDAYNRKRRECAGRYDYVIIVDCDEFVVPKYAPTIREAIISAQPPPQDHLGVEFLWTEGWNMWASRDSAPYDPSRSLLDQRDTGISSLMYSKPCIIQPGSLLRYEHGRHNFVGLLGEKPANMQSAGFHLLHYIGFDLDEFVRRGEERTSRFAKVNVLMGTSGQYLRKTNEDYRSRFLENQASEQLVRVPFRFGGTPPPIHRHLLVGAQRFSMPGWDTLDWAESISPTYSFPLLSPDWPIGSETYDEVVVQSSLSGLKSTEVSTILRRIWRIMKVGGLLRLRFSDSLASRAEEFDTMRTALFKAGFMDIEDASAVYLDADFPSAGIASAFKQAQGGMFGWAPR